MAQKYSEKIAQIAFIAVLILCLCLIQSPFSVAEQTNSSGILFIIGNRADESPISGIEIEVFRNTEEGKPGERIGNYVSRSDKTGDGLMTIDLTPGSYSYRVVTKEYQLTGEAEWESFDIEGDDRAVFLWVRPRGYETEIKEEQVALGAPEVTFNTERTTDEIHADAKGDHKGFQLNLMRLLDISGNVWMTLGVLAGMILGVIGLDFLIRLRKR